MAVKKLLQWLRAQYMRFVNAVRGVNLRKHLENPDSPERSAAIDAVGRVVARTRIPPDCVSAGEINGGCGIKIKHDGAHEWFVGYTYEQAADEAIKWLQYQYDFDHRGKITSHISTRGTSKLSRKDRRAAEALRRKGRKRRD
jgi:hypothetical protein